MSRAPGLPLKRRRVTRMTARLTSRQVLDVKMRGSRSKVGITGEIPQVNAEAHFPQWDNCCFDVQLEPRRLPLLRQVTGTNVTCQVMTFDSRVPQSVSEWDVHGTLEISVLCVSCSEQQVVSQTVGAGHFQTFTALDEQDVG